MKNLFWIFLMISCQCYGQRDYCKDIKQEDSRPAGGVNYHAPLVGKSSILGITKRIEDTTASFSIYVAVVNPHSLKEAAGVQLQLADGTILKNDASSIFCTMTDADQYTLSGNIEVEESDIEALASDRIVRITCGGVTHEVLLKDATLFMSYVRCLMDR